MNFKASEKKIYKSNNLAQNTSWSITDFDEYSEAFLKAY